MPIRDDARTIEDIREQARLRQQRFYNKHIKSERKRKREAQAEKRRLSKTIQRTASEQV